MHKIFTLFFLITSNYLNSQNLKGVILDQDSKQPIVNAIIFFPELNTGIESDTNGEFQFKDEISIKSTIQISKIGYKTKLINLNNFQNDLKIELESNHIQMQEVVVSVPKGKLQNENNTQVAKRDIKQLREIAPTSLTDALTSIAGIEQQSTGVGISKPIIRGLTGNRIVSYAQDIRVENQQWGDEHGLGVADLGIEGVEIIKGPSSLLYGSDALGGVIYFVEERYAKTNSLESYWQPNLQTNNMNIHNSLALKVNKSKLKWNLFGSYGSAFDYQLPSTLRANNTRFNETNLKSALGYANKNWIGNLRYSYINNNFGITEDSSQTSSTERTISTPFQRINNHSFSLSNSFYIQRSPNLASSVLNLILGYSTNLRREYEDNPDIAALSMRLNTMTYNMKWTTSLMKDKWNLILGSQGMHQTNQNESEAALIPNSTINDIGIYGMVNTSFRNWTIQAGLRLDYRNILCQEMMEDTIPKFNNLDRRFINPNFSIGASYTKKNWSLRTNLSNGFRSPNTSELSSNGLHEGTKRFELGNNDLNVEHATQFDVSADYLSEHFHISVNPFINRIVDYIYLQPTGMIIDDAPVNEFRQTNATLYGGELGIHYHPHLIHWLHLESNLSSIYAKDDAGRPLPLIPATRINTTIKAELKSFIKNIYINHLYKFDQNQLSQFETYSPSYQLINIGANLEIKTKSKPFELNFVIKNILNQTYIDHLSRFKNIGLANQGIGFAISFNANLTDCFQRKNK